MTRTVYSVGEAFRVREAALHFVGFRGDRPDGSNDYLSAIHVWGRPGFIHLGNDPRMRREIDPSDTIVFANGSEARPSERNYPDTTERLTP